MKNKSVYIILLVIFAFTHFEKIVQADEFKNFIFTINHVSEGYILEESFWYYKEIDTEKLSTIETAEKIFNDYFDEEKTSSLYLPKNVNLLNIFFKDNHLYINVSDDILKYGGNFYENNLRAELIKNALEIDNVDYFTLFIEGKSSLLTEGSAIYKESEIPEIF